MNDTEKAPRRGDRVRSLEWDDHYGVVTRDDDGETVCVQWDETNFEDERDSGAVELVTE